MVIRVALPARQVIRLGRERADPHLAGKQPSFGHQLIQSALTLVHHAAQQLGENLFSLFLGVETLLFPPTAHYVHQRGAAARQMASKEHGGGDSKGSFEQSRRTETERT